MSKTADDQISDDNWVTVGSSRKGTLKVNLHGTSPLTPDKSATVEQLTTDFERKMKTWRSSSCRQQIHKMLDREEPDDGWNITKALCIGSGSFSSVNWTSSKRSMVQIVAFIDTVRHLQEAASTQIQTFVQEPAYNDVDKEFLSTLGVEVLAINLAEAVHEGFCLAKAHFGQQTMAFELYIEMGTERVQDLCEADFRLYLGSLNQRADLNPFLEKARLNRQHDPAGGKFTDDELEDFQEQRDLAQRFMKDHRSLKFPQFEEDPLVFEGLMFHWREPKDDDDSNNDET